MRELGYLDAITSSGYVEGWAFNKINPSRPCHVSVRDESGVEVASGLAHRYRDDLASAGIGFGWCAFRLRSAVSSLRLQRMLLTLHDRDADTCLHGPEKATYLQDSDPPIRTTEELVETDPTLLREIRQLRACDPLFNTFIKARGVSAFVRAAYVYVLGRAADETGLALYGGLIRKAVIPPFELLEILSDSEEFRARPRMLGAPNTPTCPFHAG
jgi:hypothetical protein